MSGKAFYWFPSSLRFELHPTILFNKDPIREFLKNLIQVPVNDRVCRKENWRQLPDDFRNRRPGVFFKIAILKYLRKFPRKHLCWIFFVSKIRKNILPWMFSWTFSWIFHNNHFVEHLLVAVFLICKVSLLNDGYLLFFRHLSAFWVFFTSVRLAINLEEPLWWRLQTRLFYCLHWKHMFGGELLLRQLKIHSVIKFLEWSC